MRAVVLCGTHRCTSSSRTSAAILPPPFPVNAITRTPSSCAACMASITFARVAAGRNGEQRVAALAEGAQRLGEHLLVGVIVGDRGERRSVGAQRDGGERRTLAFEAVDQLGGEMLRVGRRAAVAARQHLAAAAQRIDEQLDAAHQRRGQRLCRGELELRALGEVRRDPSPPGFPCDGFYSTYTSKRTRRAGFGCSARRADARAQRRAAVQAPGECRVLAPRDVAELVAAPAHRHRVRIVRIVRLARELEPVTDAQLAPKIGGGVIAEAGQRRVLHQEANALFGMGISPRQKKQRGYSPKASRIHCTRALAPSTRNTSNRHSASGRRER